LNLHDRFEKLKEQLDNSPEGRKRRLRLGAACGIFVLAIGVGALQLVRTSKAENSPRVPTQVMKQVEEMAEEMEQATAEEIESFKEQVANGEVEDPADDQPKEVIRPGGKKSMGYIPDRLTDPSRPPSQQPRPGQPSQGDEPQGEPENPG
jgi:hypothetical protein